MTFDPTRATLEARFQSVMGQAIKLHPTYVQVLRATFVSGANEVLRMMYSLGGDEVPEEVGAMCLQRWTDEAQQTLRSMPGVREQE